MANYSALDIANLYIRLSNDIESDSIDNLKLNKLLFFAQGWFLAKFGKVLFSDDIQAWDYGPVIHDVYHTFKCCGSLPIKEPLESFDENRLSSKELDLILDVYRTYGKYTGWALKEMTHKKGSPWDQVYQKGMNKVISPKTMLEYFKKLSLETFDIESISIPEIMEVPIDWDSSEDAVYD